MIYEINGHHLDIYGEMTVPWSEDKVSMIDYVSRLSIGEDINLVVYRNGERQELTAKFGAEVASIRKVYPGYEDIDYEVFGGMVVNSEFESLKILLVAMRQDLLNIWI